MSYSDHFKHADDIVQHLDTFVPTLDPLLQAKYTGFVTVAAVTVYEMAVKSIFIDFATSENAVFGAFVDSVLGRINGRIKIDDLKKYACQFGKTYELEFSRMLTTASDTHLHENKRDLRSTYTNLVLWRHKFAHAGTEASATYEEAVRAYQDGKMVIQCLSEAMR